MSTHKISSCAKISKSPSKSACYLEGCSGMFCLFPGIPVGDPKSEPEIFFFDVVSQANTLFHLFEKQFMDTAVPLFM